MLGEVPLQVALQRALVQHNDVIEPLTSVGTVKKSIEASRET
jgi:hypothetical protein